MQPHLAPSTPPCLLSASPYTCPSMASIHHVTCLSIDPYVCHGTHPSITLSIHHAAHPSDHLSDHLSLSDHLHTTTTHPSTHPPLSMTDHLPVSHQSLAVMNGEQSHQAKKSIGPSLTTTYFYMHLIM